jgi:c-di-GMP-binding flagellar brake protein YcgR
MTEERRRHPRHEIVGGEMAIVPLAISVRLLEISAGGVLLQSNQVAKVGSRGRLTLTLEGQPFSTEVEVRRVSTGVDNIGLRIGVMFVNPSAEHQQMIERLVQPSSTPRPRE